MNLYTLQNRRERVNSLLSLAMADGNALKALQARFLLEMINSRICKETSLSNSYSNLIA